MLVHMLCVERRTCAHRATVQRQWIDRRSRGFRAGHAHGARLVVALVALVVIGDVGRVEVSAVVAPPWLQVVELPVAVGGLAELIERPGEGHDGVRVQALGGGEGALVALPRQLHHAPLDVERRRRAVLPTIASKGGKLSGGSTLLPGSRLFGSASRPSRFSCAVRRKRRFGSRKVEYSQINIFEL